jgi:hypothetical protein
MKFSRGMRESVVSLILLPGPNPVFVKQATKIMADQSLLDYVKQQLENKIPEETIRKALLDVGWQNTLVEEAFNSMKPQNIPAPAPLAGVFATDQKPAVQAEQAKPGELEKQPKTDLGAGIRGLQSQTGVVQSVPTGNELKTDQAAGSQGQPQLQPQVQPGPIQAERIPSENVQPQEAVKPGARTSEQGLEIGGNQKEVKREIPAGENTTIPEKKEFAGQTEAPAGSDEPLGKVSALDMQFGQTFGLPVAPDKNGAMPGVSAQKPVLEEMTSGREKAGISESEAEVKMEASKGKEKEKNEPEMDGSGRKTKRKTIFFALIGLLAILLAGVSGAAYYFFVMTPSVTPETVFKQTADNMAKVKTAEFTGAATMKAQSSESGAQTYSVDFEGAVDVTDLNNRKSSAKFDLKGLNPAEQNALFAVEMIGIGGVYYVKGSNVPNVAGINLASYADQWIKIDPKNFQELTAKLPNLVQSNETAIARDLTFGRIRAILSAIETVKNFTVTGKLADEEISGIACWHYSFAIKESDDSDSAALGLPSSGEIWIGKKDHLLHKIASSADGNPSYELVFKSFDQSVSIAAPEFFRAIEEIFGELTTAKVVETETGIPAVSADTKRMNDMASLFSAQKTWFIANKRFFTCGTGGGDCGGKANNFPDVIGNYLTVALADPVNGGTVCGQDFTYCGIDNSKNSKNFCYYAKLEDGTFITSSPYGNFKREIVPKTFKECQQGTLIELPKPGIGGGEMTGAPVSAAAERDLARQSDMRQFVSAQEMYYGANNKYLASSAMPAAIGNYLTSVPADPGGGAVISCDQRNPAFVYCGLDNTANDQKFCYFAKLESGGYFTASQAGNFKRSNKPASFDDCVTPE